MSEQLGPDLVTKLLGPYLKRLTGHLQDWGATVDKFIGDAVVAFWGAPHPRSDHPLAACQAALEIKGVLADLQQSWAELNIPPLRTRIGINSGEALVGNIGFEERLSYTALGDTMNLAARLESLNKLYGTTILVGEATFRATGGAVRGRLVDKVAVKGKTIGTEIYEIYREEDLPAQWDSFLQRFEEGYAFYTAGDFDRAMVSFTRALEIVPADGPTHVLHGRAQRYRDAPSDFLANWNGVTVLQDK